MILYHVTSIENFPKIINEGLKLNNGQIFLFDDKKYATSIALNQCGLMQYALFKIVKLEKNRLTSDNVGEISAHSQWIYDQSIPKENVKLLNCFTITINCREIDAAKIK